MKVYIILLLLLLSGCGKIGPLITDEEYALKTGKTGKNQFNDNV